MKIKKYKIELIPNSLGKHLQTIIGMHSNIKRQFFVIRLSKRKGDVKRIIPSSDKMFDTIMAEVKNHPLFNKGYTIPLETKIQGYIQTIIVPTYEPIDSLK